MPSSVVEIWNLAVARVGQDDPINSENEVSALANILRAAWPTTRDLFLETFDWDFARRHGPLTLITDEVELVDGWMMAYEWPMGDVVCFRGIPNPVAGSEILIPYTKMLRVSGNDMKIMTDLPSANGFWTERIIDVSRYPASFVQAVTYALEAEIVGAISRDENKRERVRMLTRSAFSVAAVSVANQEQPRIIEQSTPRSIKARA